MSPARKHGRNTKDKKYAFLRITHLLSLFLTSSCEEPMLNPNPEKPLEGESEVRENGKAGDFISEVLWCGELPGLTLHEHTQKT